MPIRPQAQWIKPPLRLKSVNFDHEMMEIGLIAQYLIFSAVRNFKFRHMLLYHSWPKFAVLLLKIQVDTLYWFQSVVQGLPLNHRGTPGFP
jgi:hypothetical protein